jgi:hypothetical protein
MISMLCALFSQFLSFCFLFSVSFVVTPRFFVGVNPCLSLSILFVDALLQSRFVTMLIALSDLFFALVSFAKAV